MAEVVNLRHRRKLAARAEKEARAEANRLRFGRTKAEKTRDAAERSRAARDLDSKRIED